MSCAFYPKTTSPKTIRSIRDERGLRAARFRRGCSLRQAAFRQAPPRQNRCFARGFCIGFSHPSQKILSLILPPHFYRPRILTPDKALPTRPSASLCRQQLRPRPLATHHNARRRRQTKVERQTRDEEVRPLSPGGPILGGREYLLGKAFLIRFDAAFSRRDRLCRPSSTGCPGPTPKAVRAVLRRGARPTARPLPRKARQRCAEAPACSPARRPARRGFRPSRPPPRGAGATLRSARHRRPRARAPVPALAGRSALARPQLAPRRGQSTHHNGTHSAPTLAWRNRRRLPARSARSYRPRAQLGRGAALAARTLAAVARLHGAPRKLAESRRPSFGG